MYSDDSTICDRTILHTAFSATVIVPSLSRGNADAMAANANREISAGMETRVFLPTVPALTRAYPAIRPVVIASQERGKRIMAGAAMCALLGAPLLALCAIATPATLTALGVMGGAFAMGAEVIAEWQAQEVA